MKNLTNCAKYYICYNGNLLVTEREGGLHFNPTRKTCQTKLVTHKNNEKPDILFEAFLKNGWCHNDVVAGVILQIKV